jgi:hypothetical protein
MIVIFSVANMSSGAFEISVQRPQHNANASRIYQSLEQTKAVLLNFGIAQEVLDESLKLLPQVEAGKHLTFPPIDVPHHELAAEGFKLGIFG